MDTHRIDEKQRERLLCIYKLISHIPGFKSRIEEIYDSPEMLEDLCKEVSIVLHAYIFYLFGNSTASSNR